MRSIKFILFSFGVANLASAAVPKSLTTATSEGDRLIHEALKLPLENRVQALRSQGDLAALRLKQLAFDRSQSLELRWRAITSLPRLDAQLGRLALVEALKSDEWYMRNAATLALPALDRQFAMDQSSELISDPALVVRTAAAQNLLRLNAREKSDLLWEKLYSPENFHHGESLWVRRHLAKALSEFAMAGQEPKFIRLLQDKDQRLHPFAIRALEKISGRSSAARKTVAQSRDQWLKWWQNQSSSAAF